MASFVTGENYLALPRNPQKWLVEDLIPSSGLVLWYGRAKTGKSMSVLDLACAIASDEPTWNGFSVVQHGPVMYLQIDTPRTEFGDRVEKLNNMGRDFSRVHIADLDIIPKFPFDILDPEKKNYGWLRQELDRVKPVLVVIDTLRDAHSGDENDATVMRNVILELVAATRPATVMFMSHSKKASAFSKMGGDDIIDDNRGSSVVAGKMDNIVCLTKTRLSWEGRSGKGSVQIRIEQVGPENSDTWLVVLDGDAEKEAAAVNRVVAQQRQLDAKATMTTCATALRAELGWDKKQQRTALRRVKPFFEEE